MKRRFLTIVTACAMAALVMGCGGGGDETASTTKKPATAKPATSKPAAGSRAEIQVVIIRPVGEEMKYATTEFTVHSGAPVKLVMENTATLEAMQHNVVIIKPGTDTNEVGTAAIQAAETDYIPKHDAILFYTEMAKPGETKEIQFNAPPAGDYPYLCTFPGHFALMKGVMHSVD